MSFSCGAISHSALLSFDFAFKFSQVLAGFALYCMFFLFLLDVLWGLKESMVFPKCLA